MKWIRERDALIAQTLAFVQSVTGKKDELRGPDEPPAAPPGSTVVMSSLVIEEILDIVEAPADRTPKAAAPPPQPFEVAPPRKTGDFRDEVQARVANFRKHQERFEREREEYCATTLAKLRADIREGAASPPPTRK